MPDLYFESAGMILTLVTVGKYLEALPQQTTGAISRSAGSGPGERRGAPSGTGAHHPHGGDRGP